MSAAELRSAAARIRHDLDFGQAHGDPDFLAAVADWLDATAAAVAAGSWPPGGALEVARAYLGEQS